MATMGVTHLLATLCFINFAANLWSLDSQSLLLHCLASVALTAIIGFSVLVSSAGQQSNSTCSPKQELSWHCTPNSHLESKALEAL